MCESDNLRAGRAWLGLSDCGMSGKRKGWWWGLVSRAALVAME